MKMPYFAALAAFAITYAVLAILYFELAPRLFRERNTLLHAIVFVISLMAAGIAFKYAS